MSMMAQGVFVSDTATCVVPSRVAVEQKEREGESVPFQMVRQRWRDDARTSIPVGVWQHLKAKEWKIIINHFSESF